MDHGWGNEFDQCPNGFLEIEGFHIPVLSNGENIFMEPSHMDLPLLSTIHNSSSFNTSQFAHFDYASHCQDSQICNVMQPNESNATECPKLRHCNSLSDSYCGDMNEFVQDPENGIFQHKSCKRKCPQRNPVQREIHILAERQRREEMNEKFSMLRSIVPKLSKKDKASVVAEAIKHLLELEKKVKSLQALKTIKEKEGKLGGAKSFSSTTHLGFGGKIESSKTMENQKEFNKDIGTFSRHFGEGNRNEHSSEIEVESFGRQAIIKILSPWMSELLLQTHKALDNFKVDVLQSTMAKSGGKMVYYITIDRIEGTPCIDQLMNALEQTLKSVTHV